MLTSAPPGGPLIPLNTVAKSRPRGPLTVAHVGQLPSVIRSTCTRASLGTRTRVQNPACVTVTIATASRAPRRRSVTPSRAGLDPGHGDRDYLVLGIRGDHASAHVLWPTPPGSGAAHAADLKTELSLRVRRHHHARRPRQEERHHDDDSPCRRNASTASPTRRFTRVPVRSSIMVTTWLPSARCRRAQMERRCRSARAAPASPWSGACSFPSCSPLCAGTRTSSAVTSASRNARTATVAPPSSRRAAPPTIETSKTPAA